MKNKTASERMEIIKQMVSDANGKSMRVFDFDNSDNVALYFYLHLKPNTVIPEPVQVVSIDLVRKKAYCKINNEI